MLFNKHVVTIIYTLFIVFFIWIFCTDPTKPSFDKAAEFENDSIMTFGKPGYSGNYVYFVKTNTSGDLVHSNTFGDGVSASGVAILEATNGGFIILATNKVNTKFRAYIIKTNVNGDIGS